MLFYMQILLLGFIFFLSNSTYAGDQLIPAIPGIRYEFWNNNWPHFGMPQHRQLQAIKHAMGWTEFGPKEELEITSILNLNGWKHLEQRELNILRERWSPLRASWMSARHRAGLLAQNTQKARSKRPKTS